MEAHQRHEFTEHELEVNTAKQWLAPCLRRPGRESNKCEVPSSLTVVELERSQRTEDAVPWRRPKSAARGRTLLRACYCCQVSVTELLNKGSPAFFGDVRSLERSQMDRSAQGILP